MSEPSFRPPRTKPIRPLRLPYSEVPSVLTSLRESNAWPSPKLALEFAVLTATRSREILGAPWDEMDLERALWTVPPHRTKSCLAHSVPLSGQALAVLAEARQLGDGEGLVFPNPRGGPLSLSSLSALLAFGSPSPAWHRAGSPLVPGELPGLVRRHCRANTGSGGLSPFCPV